MIAINQGYQGHLRHYYQGSESIDGFNFPGLTIGYRCTVKEVDSSGYDNGCLKIRVNGGLSERDIPLSGNALLRFMKSIGLQDPKKLQGRRVSVVLNRESGIEAIGRRV